jgi:hypothetical protein
MVAHSSTARDHAIHDYERLAPGSAKPGEATEAYKDIDGLGVCFVQSYGIDTTTTENHRNWTRL